MAQRYKNPKALEWMDEGLCPECGKLPEEHIASPNFWDHWGICSLLPRGVDERIEQFRADRYAEQIEITPERVEAARKHASGQ